MGRAWTAQQGSDSLAQQQAEGPVPELGYVMVTGEAGPSATPSGSSSGSSSVAIILIVLAACVGLIGAWD